MSSAAITSKLAPNLPPRALERLRTIDAEDRQLAAQLEDPAILSDHKKVRDLSIKRSAIAPVVLGFREFSALEKEATELEAAIAGGQDPEFAALARAELPTIKTKAAALIEQVLSRLVTTDDRKVGSVMMEVRGGTGGDEASLWARDLLEMYQKYAGKRGWSFEVLDLTTEEGMGGIRKRPSSTSRARASGPNSPSKLAFTA